MRDNVKSGDKIITIGGFVGRVRRVTDDELEVDFNGTMLRIKNGPSALSIPTSK